MNPIRLPRAAVQLVAAAAPGDLVQIQQRAEAAVLTVAAGQRVLRLAAMPGPHAGTVDPFAVSAGDLAKAAEEVGASGPGPAGELPLVVVRISATAAGIAGPSGTPQTITISAMPFPDCSGQIDAVEGERASGMTRAVAAAEPRHLLELAEAALAIGCTAVQFTFAPRFGAVLAEAEAVGVAATVVLTGQAHAEPVLPAVAAADPMVFTMPEATPRRAAKRSAAKPPPLSFEDEIPW